jgi:flagellar basal-body rod protein FlgB
MAISDLPILSMLSKSMRWHQERQRLLAENVANSDTPNFKPRDLAPLTSTRR